MASVYDGIPVPMIPHVHHQMHACTSPVKQVISALIRVTMQSVDQMPTAWFNITKLAVSAMSPSPGTHMTWSWDAHPLPRNRHEFAQQMNPVVITKSADRSMDSILVWIHVRWHPVDQILPVVSLIGERIASAKIPDSLVTHTI
jgi:hypothetical protein